MTIWFTADTHFGHQHIIALCKRPFKHAASMDETMIMTWNSRINPNDSVFFLGDFCHHASNPAELFYRLNGNKTLIKGNHDHQQTIELPWGAVHDIFELRFEKRRIAMCHYPMLEWPGMHTGAIHVHGHQHNKQPFQNNTAMDVGVDAHNFWPVSIETVFRSWDEWQDRKKVPA